GAAPPTYRTRSVCSASTWTVSEPAGPEPSAPSSMVLAGGTSPCRDRSVLPSAIAHQPSARSSRISRSTVRETSQLAARPRQTAVPPPFLPGLSPFLLDLAMLGGPEPRQPRKIQRP